jgi:hypothetical protein
MRHSTNNLRRTGLALAFFATIASALLFAGSAFAADGNSGNAKLCQKGGWQTLMDSSANAFANEGACVSYGAQGGAIFALARLHVEPCDQQPPDGLCVSTSGFGLKPTTIVTTPILKNGVPITTEFLIVPASGSVNGNPFAHFEAPCVAGNVYSATASGTSADSLSSPTVPGIDITSNTVTRTSSCP